ncbi:MAG: 50S ribosomal protein L21 [Alphaproteobacteria bacterium]|nr:MAG: 50S ribosomal protein L21 [Alphaproteobacteria bacterium]TMJ43896.1 MAG: 50S ribosomal protein L21 [Alphaproteobacteria bacterium]
MYAVIKTGGKQYRVAADDKLQIEKLPGEAGDIVEFTDVLMVASDGSVDVGAPFVAGATVAAEIIGQVRGPKIIIFKKHRRKHFRRKNGHRQDLTSVRITEILTGGAKPAKKAAAKPAKAEKTTETAPAETAPAATSASKTKAPAKPARAKVDKEAKAEKAKAAKKSKE